MRRLLVLLSLLLCVGCAPNLTLIDSRGNPLPSEFVQLNSLYGIRCDFHFKRIYYKGAESEYPEFLSIDERVKLPRNTKEVALVLHIVNTQRVYLRVTKHLTVDGKHTQWIVYEGNEFDRVFQMKGPINDGRLIDMWATVEVKGRVVVLAGRALYKTPK